MKHSELLREINRLRKILPPDSANGRYSALQNDRIRAFIVLSHAAIEDFLERLARHAADQLHRREIDGRSVRRASASLMYALGRHHGVGGSRESKGSPDFVHAALTTRLESARKWIDASAKRNNGIQEEYLEELFSCFGFYKSIEAPLIADLTTLAVWRGQAAHLSALGIRTQLTPSQVREHVLRIVGSSRPRSSGLHRLVEIVHLETS
jgi:hypothetical protein